MKSPAERDAEALADVLARWWAERGHANVVAHVVRQPLAGAFVFGVRSNLRRGLPPRAVAPLPAVRPVPRPLWIPDRARLMAGR